MSLKFGLLGIIDDRPMTGYDLMKVFNGSLKHFWNAQTSQIYRDLATLERDGFLESEIEAQNGKPDKKNYFITEAGRESLISWVNDCDFSSVLTYRDPLCMKIFFSSKGDSYRLIAGLDDFILKNRALIIKYDEKDAALDNITKLPSKILESRKYWKMTISKGRFDCMSNIEWAKESIKILKEEIKEKL